MGTRGRTSGAELAIATKTPLETSERVRPPHDLTDEAVEVWVKVVNSEPASWFTPATMPLLAQYCRHVIEARRIGELIERATGDKNLSVQDYDKLLSMQGRESNALALLATKMRLAQQSTSNHRGNKKTTATRKLWE